MVVLPSPGLGLVTMMLLRPVLSDVNCRLVRSERNDSAATGGRPVSMALVRVAGNAPAVSQRGNFYQGGKSIPTPLLVCRQSGRASLEVIAAEVIALSKMDWNNDALYGPLPVTVRYAQRLARTIANVPTMRRAAYPYRLFL